MLFRKISQWLFVTTKGCTIIFFHDRALWCKGIRVKISISFIEFFEVYLIKTPNYLINFNKFFCFANLRIVHSINFSYKVLIREIRSFHEIRLSSAYKFLFENITKISHYEQNGQVSWIMKTFKIFEGRKRCLPILLHESLWI